MQAESGAGERRDELDGRCTLVFKRGALEGGNRLSGVFVADGLNGKRVVLLGCASEAGIEVGQLEADVGSFGV